MKFVETKFSNKKDILKFPDHYVAVAVTLDDAGVEANSEGKKIIPAGTILGGGVLQDASKLAKKASGADAEGIVMNDTDVTYGPASGAMIIHGFIDSTKIPTPPDDATKAALNQITFLA